jgi:hypothetical protein
MTVFFYIYAGAYVSKNRSKCSCTTRPTLSSTLGIGAPSGFLGRLVLAGIWSSANPSSSLWGPTLSVGGPPGLANEPLCKGRCFKPPTRALESKKLSEGRTWLMGDAIMSVWLPKLNLVFKNCLMKNGCTRTLALAFKGTRKFDATSARTRVPGHRNL